ncbi:enoyl-CoA hydratase/isomerase family protein [Marinactinospora rubrisoli]|uniref:Enoyl-CoA hydratase/isomerase family protein n=1 Tax=Marinactinospora rubrisoli TaxID=2715399 RepID=A0ABW2KDC6_9ACTN
MTSERGTDELITVAEGPVLTVTFNRPEQRNAMTWDMYDGLYAACERADADPGIRAMVLRGAGEQAFVAGTDIGQFADFAGGFDGVEYERRIERVIERIADVTVPTVAAVRGVCVGGGLAIAAACDLRIATPGSRFGVPIARTLGNCLSMNTYNLLVFHLGPARTLDLLLNARLYSGSEAHAAGFVAELAEPAELDAVLGRAIQRLLGHAPITMWATKRAVHRLRRAGVPTGDDLVSAAFGSEDFQQAVRAFAEKRRPEWRGR